MSHKTATKNTVLASDVKIPYYRTFTKDRLHTNACQTVHLFFALLHPWYISVIYTWSIYTTITYFTYFSTKCTDRKNTCVSLVFVDPHRLDRKGFPRETSAPYQCLGSGCKTPRPHRLTNLSRSTHCIVGRRKIVRPEAHDVGQPSWRHPNGPWRWKRLKKLFFIA